MLHLHLKLPAAGGCSALLALLLAVWAVQGGAALPRHHAYHRFRSGGDGEGPASAPVPASASASAPPNSDMMKALEYIENLKQQQQQQQQQQRNGGGGAGGGGGREEPVDYDEVDKFRVLLQLASLQDEGATTTTTDDHQQPRVPAPRSDVSAEQLVKALLKSLQEQAGRSAQSAPAAPAAPLPAAAAEPRNDRRAYRHRNPGTGAGIGPVNPPSSPSEFGNFPRPHKKYPLMFEDEENRDAYKRATEDLDEQYTPQSLANLRSIFEELGRMPAAVAAASTGQRRDLGPGDEEEEEDDDDDDEEQQPEEEMFNPRNLAYEDVAGGEDWLPMEEREETEELEENRSREELTRGQPGEMQRRGASPNDEDSEDDTKLVDYYLLKVLEMSDQTQKRDQTGEQKKKKKMKRLIRPSILDPRTVRELLELSLKLHVPPQDLIDMLITEEIRKLHRHPQPATPYRSGGPAPKVRYYSRRLPLKNKSPPPASSEDMDREDFLDIIGVETISSEYPVIQRPAKPVSSPLDKVPAQPAAAKPAPAKTPAAASSGRRENLFLSELNKMPFKRQTAGAVADDDDDDDVEDEVTTYLAAKILTEYPSTMAKRDTRAQQRHAGGRGFPYELYEQAMKDYLDLGKVAKREAVAEEEDGDDDDGGVGSPAEDQGKEEQQEEEEAAAKTSTAPQTVNEEEKKQQQQQQQQRGKPMAGM